MTLFMIDSTDNVATALETLEPGEATFAGGATGVVRVLEKVERGHKVALKDIPAGTAVVKHGHPVAVAFRDISAGEWVHTHNAGSMCDR